MEEDIRKLDKSSVPESFAIPHKQDGEDNEPAKPLSESGDHGNENNQSLPDVTNEGVGVVEHGEKGVDTSLGNGEDKDKKSDKASDVDGKEKGSKTKSKGKKKVKRVKHAHISLSEIPAFIFPQHVGDIFVVLMVLALAIGAASFWFVAWIPTNSTPTQAPQGNIQQFSDTELQDIITILDNREEASKAPVITPTRDPFFAL